MTEIADERQRLPLNGDVYTIQVEVRGPPTTDVIGREGAAYRVKVVGSDDWFWITKAALRALASPSEGNKKGDIGEPVADKIDLAFEPGVERPLSAETLAALKEIDAHRVSRPQPRKATTGEWRCFHCDEVFTLWATAQEHFGGNSAATPACEINVAEYRRMEEVHRQHLAENDEASRRYYTQADDHRRALIREEEKGYARGLADASALSVSPAAAQGWQTVEVPKIALDWLFGRGPDHEGQWFADAGTDRPKGNFWWRTRFNQIVAAAPPSPAAQEQK